MIYTLIKNKSVKLIVKKAKKYPTLMLLILLAMHPNNNMKDYKIFSNEVPKKIDLGKLSNIVTKNIYSETDYEVPQGPFYRLSYKKSQQ